MSDVWQGPGWWLASDGKWYPAEAESGAVFEGEIPGMDTAEAATASVATPEVTEPAATEPTVAEPVVEEPVVAEPVIAEPVVAEPVVAEEIAVEPDIAEPVVAESSFDSESPFDGSESPFAEVDVPEVEAPEVDVPEVDIAEVDVPEGDVPEVAETDLTPDDLAVPEDVDIAEAPVAASGWQAVTEPEEQVLAEGWQTSLPEEATVPAVDLSPPALPDTELPAIDGTELPATDGTELPAIDVTESSAIGGIELPEIPEVEAPSVPDLPLVEEPAATLTSAPLATFEPPVIATPEFEEVSRDDAWRKPSAEAQDTLAAPLATSTTKPDVVDLAVPESTTPPLFEDSGPNKGVIGGAVAALVLLGGIIWLSLRLFSNGDEVAETETDVPDAEQSEDEAGILDGAENTEDDSGTDSEEGGQVISVFDIRAGDCIIGDIDGQILEVERVDCDEPHDFEIYREAIIDTVPEFDEIAISAFAEDVCRTSLAELVSPDDDRGISFKFFQPTVDSWNQTQNPDRLVTCLGFDDDAQLIGRLDES